MISTQCSQCDGNANDCLQCEIVLRVAALMCGYQTRDQFFLLYQDDEHITVRVMVKPYKRCSSITPALCTESSLGVRCRYLRRSIGWMEPQIVFLGCGVQAHVGWKLAECHVC